jgi:hypothetical protein
VKQLMMLVKKYHYLVAGALLALMFGLGATSMAHDSAIVDELAHIPAGYSYLQYHDYRLNPEHPPLIKDLAAVPLQFMPLSFPIDNPAWTTDVNGQWESGWHFLYHDGNNANAILFWARLPILLLAIVFGAVLYWFVRQRFGTGVGLLAVFLYSLEPNILAHARFVTTDLGAAAFMFISFIFFVRFMEKPNRINAIWATVFLAAAQLAKFSAVLLIPWFIVMVVVAVALWPSYESWKQRLWVYGGGLVAIGAGALLLVWLFYLPQTWSMPADVQYRLVDGSLKYSNWHVVGMKLVSFNHIPGVKALVQYLLGVMMVFSRVAGGNTTFFLGQVSNQSFVWYFPVTYLIKTPVAFLFLLATAVVGALVRYFRKSPAQVLDNLRVFARKHFVRLSMFAFVVIYSYVSITGNLNLGIRHLLPMLPFILVLVSYEVVSLGRKRGAWPVVMLAVLMGWYAASNFLAYPSYLSYFNELIGGPGNADKYVSDSSVDWGQDLLRLQDYVKTNHIEHIAVDYFGGGEPRYYFCDRLHTPDGALIKDSTGYDCTHSPYIEWHAQNGLYKGYMAVSETYLTNDIYWSKQRGDAGYGALRAMTPVAKIGSSIYIYKTD